MTAALAFGRFTGSFLWYGHCCGSCINWFYTHVSRGSLTLSARKATAIRDMPLANARRMFEG